MGEIVCDPAGWRQDNCPDKFPQSFSLSASLKGHFDRGDSVKHSVKEPEQIFSHTVKISDLIQLFMKEFVVLKSFSWNFFLLG